MKAYTDIFQSKKLAEFLPLESADGFWEYHDKWCSEGYEWEGYEDYPKTEPYLEYPRKENEWKENKSDVPCWSLATLMDVLDRGASFKTSQGWACQAYIGPKAIISNFHNNPVDACYEIIIRLHELNLL